VIVQQHDIQYLVIYYSTCRFTAFKSGQYGPAADFDIVDISGEEAVRRAAAVSDKTNSNLSRALLDSHLCIDDRVNPHCLKMSKVLERIADFQGPGGIIDLVYSAVFTRGRK